MSNFFKNLKAMWSNDEDFEEEIFEDNNISKITKKEEFPQQIISDMTNSDDIINKGKEEEFKFNNKNVLNLNKKSIKIACFKPESYGPKTLLIANELLQGNIAVIDLDGVDSGKNHDAKRIIDFLCGIVHAKQGQFMKVSINTYVLTPKNIEINGAELRSELLGNDII
ncbi:MAG: cell division protein SepF [Candidatus Improbicoccus devescovinae]|nr:MAG: cell division protein SepF [Candidatus Improbicoccus devescovinae]